MVLDFKILLYSIIHSPYFIDVQFIKCYSTDIMSIRENIELYGSLDLESNKHLQMNIKPSHIQANPMLILWKVRHSINLSNWKIMFQLWDLNMVPLPYSAFEVLLQHPKLAPDDVYIRWTQEQELIFEGTLGELRRESNNTDGSGK